MKAAIIITMLTLALSLGACGNRSNSAYRTPDDLSRDTVRAQSLSQEAAKIITVDPEKAERLLREALERDIFFGPAHNNLGVIFLERGELYSAANEFEWARKLMPGHPDPRINLALALERAGQMDDAASTYRAALELAPLHIDALTGLARLQLRSGDEHGETRELLRSIERHTDDPALRLWASDQSAKLR